MDSSKIKAILIAVFGAFFAVYLGIAAATSQFEAFAWIGGITALVTLLALGRHVWVLIPLCLGFEGSLNLIPGSPAPWTLAGAAATCMVLTRFLLRKSNEHRFRFTLLDFAVLLQAAVIAQAFARNPTGLMMLGGDLVGGKPYLIFSAAIVCYLLLSITATSFKIVRLAALGYFLSAVVDGLFQIATQIIPGLGARVLPIYSGINARSAFSGTTFEADTNRLEGGKSIGPILATAAYGYYRPIYSLIPFKPLAFFLGCGGLLFTLLSGFRSIMVYIAGLFIAGTIIRRRKIDLVIVTFVGILGLALLLGSGMTPKLPLGAQRILSVIPFAEVDESIRAGAKGSAEGRFEMWRLALLTDRYIQNKWLGDGFAYRADEQRAKMEIAFGGTKTFSRGMGFVESSLASGSYHGFHVETIRFTGGLGLACAIFLMGACIRQAWILASFYRGRPEFGTVAFLSLPFLVYPFQALLVFGAYRAEFPQFIVMAGLLKILDNLRVQEIAEARTTEIPPQVTNLPTKRPQSRNLAQHAFMNS